MKLDRIYQKKKIHILVSLLLILAAFSGCNNGAGKAEESGSAETPSIIVDTNVISFEITEKEEVPEEDDTESEVEEEIFNLPLIEEIALDPTWQYADFSEIHTGCAVLFRAAENRKNIVIGVNAGHGTKGGTSVKTFCHPDQSPKTTGGSTPEGSLKAAAVSSGMAFYDGTAEATVTFEMALYLKEKLLSEGYDVLMLRNDEDVQLDNIARTVIANNNANCHIAIHWDGDNLNYDKGCFYISTPDGIKDMEPVSGIWPEHELLGQSLIDGLTSSGCKIYRDGKTAVDLTQTSYSTIPSVDIELGNAASTHEEADYEKLAEGFIIGINNYFQVNQ